MTVQEANEYLKQLFEEVEQYRALGTVEELKEAREKQVAKDWIHNIEYDGEETWECPCCHEIFVLTFGTVKTNLYHYCPNCGQKLDWSDEE